MMNKIMSASIKTKLYVIVSLSLIVPFSLFGYIGYSESTKIIEKIAISDSEQLVSQQNLYLNNYFESLERTINPLMIHPVIQNYLKLESEDNFEFFQLSNRFEEEIAPELYGRGDVKSFTLVSEEVGSSLKSYDKYIQYKSEDAPKLLSFDLRGITTEDSLPVLTLTRSFVDYHTFSKTGMFIINLKMNKIKEIVGNSHIGDSGVLWITDENGTILFHPEKQKLGTQVSRIYIREIFGNEKQMEDSFIRELNGEKKLITYQTSEITNLTIITEIPLETLIGRLKSIRFITIVVCLLIIAFALSVVGWYSLSLTRSLSNLQHLMKRAESGDFHIRAHEKRKDEIGKVNRSFNKMVSELQRLVQVVHKSQLKEKEMEIKQRESSLKAMQSQINPHFLYNTLEIINSNAILEGNMTISRMATSLADMFRYNISNINHIVTLKEEIEHVKSYLDIQSERYENLQIQLDFPEQLVGKIQTVKLILQPLIENSFEHGYENHKTKPTFLQIKGQASGHLFYVDIVDHGKGMPGDTLEKYQRAFSLQGTAHESMAIKQMNSIGLWNVHSRIRLAFGDEYGLNIIHSNESGTMIRITLPLQE
jgi:two-component system, sensor histidine kinase YesM